MDATRDVKREPGWFFDRHAEEFRDDPILVGIVEEIGVKTASGDYSSIGIVEIPDDVPADGWVIKEYDGIEWVAEKHRTWHAY